MKRWLTYAGFAALLLTLGNAQAGTINVLWYTGGVTTGGTPSYESQINTLAGLAPSSPGGNTWNVTYWGSGAMPTGSYNVLVVASPEGGWGTNPDYSTLQSAVSGGLTFGDRVMLTGQDADWHYTNGGMPTPFDGPQGFLLDSINWAGSGSGLGLVALGTSGTGSCWGATDLGLTGYTAVCNSTNSVVIPGAVATNPVNTNLTSAGLSNWGTSAHAEFTGLNTSMWTGINVDGFSPSNYVTIVSAGTVGGGITPGGGGVPEPAPIGLMLLGCAALLVTRRRAAD